MLFSIVAHDMHIIIFKSTANTKEEKKMKAITTKYHGPTNTRGARITASDEDGNRVSISYPYELSGEDVHRKAADRLCEKMGWKGRLVGGSLKNGYVFVWDGNTNIIEDERG
jgi:hypothetical protein